MVTPVLVVAQLFHRFSYKMEVVITLPLTVDVFHLSLAKATPVTKLPAIPIKNPTSSNAVDIVEIDPEEKKCTALKEQIR